MKISAVICEYNPFHNGHKYLNHAAKTQCDALVAVMSASFTQRGDVAVFSKYERARAALENGADLVLELPTVYAVSPAQCFAESGVAVASALGCVDSLVFGSECGDTRLLKNLAAAVERDDIQALIREKMNGGLYYPRALSEAFKEIFGVETANTLSNPNDILAVEYCRALGKSDIAPCAIKRIHAAHDSANIEDGFASASYIRSLLKSGKNPSGLLPYTKFDNPAFIENLELPILYKLRSMPPQEIEALPDVSEGLQNRIFAAARDESSLDAVLEKIKTKRYTMARLRRIFICALLGITKELRSIPVPYIRVLGFNSIGAEILSIAKKRSALPIVTKVPGSLKALNENGKKILEKEIFASDVFSLARKIPQPCGADFKEPLVII